MPKAVLDLTGKWQFKEYPADARRMRDIDDGDWLETAVPGSIFTGLIEAGRIDRTEIDTCPENFAWVSEKPWIYRKVFDTGKSAEEFRNCDRVDLVFEGLDTVASIWLNEKLIARTDNMFIRHRFDVTPHLRPGQNVLLVKFDPAEDHAKKLMHRYSKFTDADFLNPHRVFLRKAQYQFGWDWCPALPGCGIWRPVRLEAIDKAVIKNLHIRTVHCEKGYADIRVAAKLDAVLKVPLTCSLDVRDPSGRLIQQVAFEPRGNSGSSVLRIDNPLLWYPAGYGEPNLYKAELKLLCNGRTLDVTQTKFGIRTVQLNRSPDEHGEKFRFEVNGTAVYAKGADWIPATIFPGSLSGTDYEKLLNAAKDANMNMLRIWGGGYYEDDAFYELCDELGLVVWQDFMFACGLYPDRKWFFDKVRAEVNAAVTELRNHPCIVLWCGNNEIDWMYYAGSFGKGKKFYGNRIYHKILPELLTELDPDRPFIPTTPLSSSRKEPNDPGSGTVHNWNVWSCYEPVWRYACPSGQIPRFVCEFGFQAPPVTETIARFCPPAHRRLAGRLLEKHNYQIDGNSRLYRYLGDLFGVAGGLDRFVYLSQLTQARAIKTYVEFLRAHRSVNSGALFWQFNDCCPAISWSAIDYLKRPKALYYYAKRFFAKLLITAVPEFDDAKVGSAAKVKSLSAVVVNDTAESLTVQIFCRLIDLAGKILDQVQLPVSVLPFSASRPVKIPQSILLCSHPEKSALHLLVEKEGTVLAENLFFLLPDKYVDWPVADVTTEFSRLGPTEARLKLTSANLAKDVKLEIENCAELSDNFVDLFPGSQRELMVKFDSPVDRFPPEVKLLSVESALTM